MLSRHLADDHADERIPRFLKTCERNRLTGHSFETTREFMLKRDKGRRENLGHWPVVADEVDDKGLAQFLVDAFVAEEVPNIEEVARVLAIECGDDFLGVKIGERNDLHLGEAEALLYSRCCRPALWCEDAATQYRRDLDLNLGVVMTHQQTGDSLFGWTGVGTIRTPRNTDWMRFAMRCMAASISASDALRGAMGRYVRSMSTDRRGMFRRKRLIVVPLRVKPSSSATCGSAGPSGAGRPHLRPFKLSGMVMR